MLIFESDGDTWQVSYRQEQVLDSDEFGEFLPDTAKQQCVEKIGSRISEISQSYAEDYDKILGVLK